MDTLRLLRIPFSVFLMPVYWFAWSNSNGFGWGAALGVFLVLHLFAFPASNGYNSYFDRDEGSIGGLKHPPQVTRSLFIWVVIFDVLAIGIGGLIAWEFGLMVALYLAVSKAYSWDKIRLKQYPVTSTLVVTIFQGGFTYLAVQVGLGLAWSYILTPVNLGFALCASLLLVGTYPLTQVFQHEEDRQRGDRTLSLMLGIRGTFIFAGVWMLIAMTLLLGTYLWLGAWQRALVFVALTLPVGGVFMNWARAIWQDSANADFDRAMRMNIVSSISTSLAFFCMGWV